MQLVLGSQVLREELTLVQASLGDGAAVVAVGRPDLHIASSGRSGRVTIWSLGSAHLGSLGWRESAVLAVAFSRGADQLAMGAAERYPGEGSAPAVVWALPSCRQERVIEVPGSSSVRDVAFSPCGAFLATASGNGAGGAAATWRLADGARALTFEGHGALVNSVAFSACGGRLVTGSCDTTAKVWSTADASCAATFAGHSCAVSAARLSPVGRLAASCSEDGSACVWCSDSCHRLWCVLAGHLDCVWSVAFSPDGASVVTGSADGHARVWDAQSGRCNQEFACTDEDVRSVAFSPDGASVVTATDNSVRVWSLDQRECTRFWEESFAPMAVF